MATILVVDDERIDRELIRHILQRHGHVVLEAGDYSEAVELFRGQPHTIDLLVTDVAMPGKNGCELAKELLSLNPYLGVLLVSGFVGSEVCKQYGIRVDTLHYLSKPFLSDELANRIRQILASAQKSPFSSGDKIMGANPGCPT